MQWAVNEAWKSALHTSPSENSFLPFFQKSEETDYDFGLSFIFVRFHCKLCSLKHLNWNDLRIWCSEKALQDVWVWEWKDSKMRRNEHENWNVEAYICRYYTTIVFKQQIQKNLRPWFIFTDFCCFVFWFFASIPYAYSQTIMLFA